MRLIRVVLASVVVLVLVGCDASESVDTTVAETTTTSSTSTTTTSTTVAETTTTTFAETTTSTMDTEARRLEVEAIVEDLRYRWLDAMYRQDEIALRGVSATVQYFEATRANFGDIEADPYLTAPTPENVIVEVIEVLQDDDTCLVSHERTDASALREGVVVEGVTVMWPDSSGGWRIASRWSSPNESWANDCPDANSNLLEPLLES